MRAERFVRRIYFNNILILLLTVSVLTYFGVSSLVDRFELEKEQIRTQVMESKKIQVEQKVNEIYTDIQYQQAAAESILRKDIQQRVESIHKMADSIYSKNKDSLGEDKIKELIVDALREVRYNDGRGYFFIDTMEGDVILYPIQPETEGSNVINLQDSEGTYVIQNEIEIARTMGSGYVEGFWPRPERSKSRRFKKISYVKQFEPYDWYIGTGEYLDDVVLDLKHQALERAEMMSEISPVKIWIHRSNGDVLLHTEETDLIGVNLAQSSNPLARIFYTEARIHLEQQDHGYIEYEWVNKNSGLVEPKLSYIKYFTNWDWTLGAGIYLSDLEAIIKEQENQLKDEMVEYAVTVSVFSIFFLLMVLFLTSIMNNRINNVLITFTEFFEKSAQDNRRIDLNKLDFEEFKNLGKVANSMVEEREAIQEKLVESQKQAALGRVIAGVAHEINTPIGNSLTTITYFNNRTKEVNDLLSEGQLTKTTFEDYLDTVFQTTSILLSSIEAQKKIIDNFKRLSTNDQTHTLRSVNISRFLANHVHDLQKEIGLDYMIHLNCPENLVVFTDPDILELVLINLVNHSVEHGFEGMKKGQIDISVAVNDSTFIVRYTDNGNGFEKCMKDFIFDPYATSDKLNSDVGFNFHVVYNLITQVMNGSIKYLGSQDTGLIFEIELPRTLEQNKQS